MNIINFVNQKLKKMSNNQKLNIIIILFMFVFIISIAVPSLARYKNRVPVDVETVWDGSIASDYRKGKGTEDDPYIISNGAELAYLSSMLKTTDYKDTYFKLNNNIVLNNGIFNYDGGIKYTLNTTEFYIKENTTEFYDNEEFTGVKIGTVNSLEPLNNFDGHFDGNGYIIYGLYTYNDKNELSLFTNLTGTIENLYLKNSMIYGGTITGGIASTTNGATLKNIMNEGFIIGLDEGTTKEVVNELSDIERTIESNSNETITLFEDFPIVKGQVLSTVISGNLEKTGNGNITVNGSLIQTDSDGNFEIELGSKLLKNITLEYTDVSNVSIKLTNIKYTINYKELVSGGVVGISQDTTYENIINKAHVYGNANSAGLVGIINGSADILQSYNTGLITAYENAGGLISSINYTSNEVSVSKSYNNAEVNAINNAGIISNITENTGTITIKNTISIGNDYAINSISNSNIEITNSYITNGYSVKSGETTGLFELSSKLYEKNYQKDTLLYSEFVDNSDVLQNPSNVWVYEEENLPILYIDDLNNPIATLYVNTNSWNDLGYELDKVYYDEQITFSVEEVSELRPIKEIYYYVLKSETPLTKTQIESIKTPSEEGVGETNEIIWQEYTDVVHITEEGFYVIYVKTVDANDQVNYINSELLVLDLSNPTVSIRYNEYTWSDYKDTLNYIYIDNEAQLEINYDDSLSGIKEVAYYISTSVLTVDELNEIKNWIKYEENILIDKIGSYVIYAKAVDNVNKVTYANTDLIAYGGYSLNSVYVGREQLTNNINITDKSEVTFNFTYSDSNSYKDGYTHNIVSNQTLPIGTKIILKDNKNNTKYVYILNEEKAIIPFTLFKVLGTDNEIYYQEVTSDDVNEDYSIVMDLSNTSIEKNIIDLKIHLAIYDSNSTKVRTTLEKTIKSINVYVGSSESYISTSYDGNAISYDSNSTTTIPINAGVNYPSINLNKIYDSVVEDKILGLAIKMVDSEGNIINKEYLKNIKYSISDVYYGIDDDGIARINLNNGINTFNGNLTISTALDNSELETGNYYFKIYSYVSYDGKYTNSYSKEVVTIPVTNNTSKVTYSFDVLLDNSNRVISKAEENSKMQIDILQNGPFYNPNIRVSLYKKNELTAYNQKYTLVDLKEYVTNNLESTSDKIYYAFKYPVYYTGYKNTYNTLNLELINSKFENTGYKLVFELYDGNVKIGTIEKKIIAR